MTLSAVQPDLAAITARQQKTWSSGDFSVVAARIVLVERAAGRVRRPATGLAGARRGRRQRQRHARRRPLRHHALGVDYVPSLLEDGRARAVAEGLDVEFRLGDAQALPVEDDSMDAVLSVFGTMFAPDHQQTADEIVRVARAGATVGLASWTPAGFIGQMFRVITSHVPAPAGVQSPLLWGTEAHLSELFGDAVEEIHSTERICTFRFASAEEFVAFFRRWYGPTLKAFETLDDAGQTALAEDLADLARQFDRIGDGGSIAISSAYLETVLRLR